MPSRELDAWYRRTSDQIEAKKAELEKAVRDAWVATFRPPPKAVAAAQRPALTPTRPQTFEDKVARGRQIAREALARHSGHHNDEGDAQRHAEWSKQMADELGAGFSGLAGVQHEIEGLRPRVRRGDEVWRFGPLRVPEVQIDPGQPLAEAMMDMRNNAEGIMASVQGRPINPSQLQTSPARRPNGRGVTPTPYRRG